MPARFDVLSLNEDSTGPVLTYSTEADLRDGLHALADAYGWNVRSEVHVPSWGRADLVIKGSHYAYVVELKVRITKPLTLRRALQQVHGYSSVLGPCIPVVAAPDMPEWAYEMATTAYPDIDLMTVSELMGELRSHAYRRAEAINERHDATERELSIRKFARYISEPPDDEPASAGVITEGGFGAAAQAMADFLAAAERIGEAS